MSRDELGRGGLSTADNVSEDYPPRIDQGATRRRPTRLPQVRIGAVAAIAVAVAFVTWLIVHNGNESSGPKQTGSVAVSVGELRSLQASLRRPVYWAGSKSGFQYELTKTSQGQLYVRYLPAGVDVGDAQARFLTVGTYPQAKAFARLQAAARARGAVTVPIRGRGLAFYNKRRPTSVYFTYPGANYQVEVYDPSPALARSLVASGRVRPVGAKVATPTKSVAVSVGELRSLEGSLGRPVYWAGSKSGFRYELTKTQQGQVYIRYLPAGVQVGDARPGFLTVGTYPQANAFARMQVAARARGAVRVPIRGRGLAFYNKQRPTSVYFSSPGADYQVEVYDPSPARARNLVASGTIVPIR
jgi:hypothetical protein